MPSGDLILATVSLLVGVGLTLATTRIQKATATESERSRFRHEMGVLAARIRFDKYVELLHKVGECYRLKVNRDPTARDNLNRLKNFYYANRVFFGPDLVRAFMSVRRGLGIDAFDKEILEDNFNTLTQTVADDLLIEDLQRSVSRAVRSKDRRPAESA